MKKLILILFAALTAAAASARSIYLTRHGQQGDRKYYDAAVHEMKLTPLGREQAEALAHYLKEKCRFEGTILVSPLYRTIETGLPTAKLLGVKMILEPGIQEVSPGARRPRAMSFAEIEERFPGMTEKGKAFTEPWRLFGEDAAARRERVEKALRRILRENGGDLLLVTHGGILVDLMRCINAGLPPKKKVIATPWNCCLFIVELDERDVPVSVRFTTEYLPDEKVTANFGASKVPHPEDPRYARPAGQKGSRK